MISRQRKRILIHLLTLRKLVLQLNSGRRKRRWGVRPINVDRKRLGYFQTTFLNMKNNDPELFFNETRMTRSIYDLLVGLLESSLLRRSSHSISAEERLAITLAHLSQGVSEAFLSKAFHIGRATTHKIIIETCESIWKILSPVYVSKPNLQDYKLIAEKFRNSWNLPNCVGAIDGKHVNITAPHNSGSSFFNYKKSFSIVLLGVCDADYIFTNVAVGAFGSQSDGGVLNQTTFGRNLKEKRLPLPQDRSLANSATVFPHYFVGDAAFPLLTNLLKPYPGRQLTDERRIFNYRLSRGRRVIENAFGILVNRWRVLNNTIDRSPENAEKIVLACIALHNFIKLNDFTATYVPPHYVDWENENGEVQPGEWRNGAALPQWHGRSNRSSREAACLRDDLASYFVNEGSVSFQNNLAYIY